MRKQPEKDSGEVRSMKKASVVAPECNSVSWGEEQPEMRDVSRRRRRTRLKHPPDRRRSSAKVVVHTDRFVHNTSRRSDVGFFRENHRFQNMILGYKMPPEILLLVSISSLVVVIGLLLNGFIVAVNLFRWMKYQTLQTIDVLLTSLGLVRLALLIVCVEEIIFYVSGWSFLQIYDTNCEQMAFMCIDFCSLWWGSLLSVFYCVKITNYGNRLFIRLKTNISKLVPWMLLISLVISFLSSLPHRWNTFIIQHHNGTIHKNRTQEINVNLFIILFAGSIIPFLIFCFSIYLIIASLLRHTRNMSSQDSGFRDSQRDIHIGVIRNMVSFLVFYIIHAVAYINIPIFLQFRIYTFNIFCFICISAYPSLHSISLIIGNKELKKSFLANFSCTWLRNLKLQNK
ncbi:taste receptor type 2 member 1-like [Ranitomeya imitator]|uniref:taste receptor type 2 member 1-like n=1 Tax=Ranitomeya imitator TaxID=111125 RepID=UPI0037E79AAB